MAALLSAFGQPVFLRSQPPMADDTTAPRVPDASDSRISSPAPESSINASTVQDLYSNAAIATTDTAANINVLSGGTTMDFKSLPSVGQQDLFGNALDGTQSVYHASVAADGSDDQNLAS